MWGGRFASGPAAVMEKINASIDFDWHLYRQDIAASKAHAAMLAKQGIIAADDARKIAHGLDTILSEIGSGKFKFKRALEDIHMNIESRLAELIGAAGRPAAHRALAQRPGRDRFPAVDARRGSTTSTALLGDYQQALAEKALEHAATVMPGFTHLQTRAAGDVRPSPARLRRDGGSATATASPTRSARLNEFAARRRRARRHVVSDRPRHDGEGAGDSTGRWRIRSTPCPTATS